MDFAPDIPPLPDDQAYARAAMAVQGRMFRRRETPSDHLLNLTTASESLAKFSSAASTLANSVEAPNEARDNYNDLSRSASRALWLGTLAGLSIARDAHASILIPTKLFTFAPPLTVAIDPQSGEYDRLALQQEYIRTGDAGLTALGRTAVTFVTRWGVETVQQHRHRPLFSAGAGLVIQSARVMHEARVAENFDWDAGLRDLLRQDRP